MKIRPVIVLPALVFTLHTSALRADEPAAEVVSALQSVYSFLVPDAGAKAPAIEIEAKFENATGDAKVLNGRPVRLKYQAPNRFFLGTEVNGPVSLSSDGTKVWIHVPKKNMLLEGDASVPRFSTRPDSMQATKVPQLQLPVKKEQLALLPVLADISLRPSASGSTEVVITPKDAAVESLHIPKATLTADLEPGSRWPQTISFTDGKNIQATLRITSHKVSDSLAAAAGQPVAESDETTERVAVAHLVKFLENAVSSIGD